MSISMRLRVPAALVVVVSLLVIGFISAAVSRSNHEDRAKTFKPLATNSLSNHRQRATFNPLAIKSPPTKQQQRGSAEEEFENLKRRFPKVDYDSPEPSDPKERMKRREKGKHFNNGAISPIPTRYSSGLSNHWYEELSGLPVEKSSAVVIGTTLSRGAFLSNDKTGIYTELSVRIEEALQANTPLLQKNSVIDINRVGGVVRYSSGEESLFFISGQEMPSAGKRYLFFLEEMPDGTDFRIITGYELSSGRVKALDLPGQFAQFNGLDETAFLTKVRETIAHKKQQ